MVGATIPLGVHLASLVTKLILLAIKTGKKIRSLLSKSAEDRLVDAIIRKLDHDRSVQQAIVEKTVFYKVKLRRRRA